MKNKENYRQKIAGLTLILGLSSFIPVAQAAVNGTNDSQWRYEFTPYVWAVGQSGTFGLAGGPGNGQSFDQSFSDIWSNMDIAGMAAFEARYNQWGILLDAIYLRVSDDGSLSTPNGLADLSADGRVTQQQYAVAGYYRAIEGITTLDALAGLRLNSVRWNVDANLSSPLLPNSVSRKFADSERWVDPYMGVRVTHHFDQQWSVVGYADLGGAAFGSSPTWQLLGGVNYAFTPGVIGKAGYRYISIDYEKDGFIYDVETSGFYLGVGIVW
ncbi:hypothetical protein [Serratia microhaemolytica]|uniref:hypothetical protein n=1 Tax=Serratia microhaemolytica TaxID=2675110 RepID=UPI000FDE1980|nr:hypothetical protein [Serratia microhaemolytica]